MLQGLQSELQTTSIPS